MPVSTQIVEELVTEAKSDEVGLWLIIDKIKDELHTTDGQIIKAAALEAVAQLLHTGKVAAGSYKSDRTGVERWEVDVPAVVKRISHEWEKLGREPDIGDIAVFIGA